MAIKAFSLFGEIELKGDRVVVSNLKKVSHQVDVTKKDLGSLKGNFGFGGGALSGLNSALGTLSNISNVIQGIPVVGKLIDGAMSFATGPVKDMANLGLGFNDLKENATLAFAVILKDGEKAKKLFEDLAKFGAQSPIFKNSDMIRYSQMLLPITGGGSELFDALKGIGAMTAVTGDMSRMGDIFLAMTQIARKPKLSSEEMNQQLSEAGVDAWGLLARGLGRTPGEVQTMTGEGRLSGKGSFQVILAQALREYGSLVDLMGQTRTGKQAQIDDTLEQLAARGTQNLHGVWKGGQDRILDQLKGPKGGALADQIDNATGLVGEKVLGGFDALMDGSLLTKAQAAAQNVVGTVQSTIQGAGDAARQTMQGYADNLYKGFTDYWEIKSPSERAKRLGQWIREGLDMGLNKNQADNYAKMKWASEQDPDFIRAIVAGASKRGVKPDDMLNLIAIESGFNKSVMNRFGYGGLGQVGRDERKALGLPVDDGAFKQLLASKSFSWQVSNVLMPFLDMKLKENPGVLRDGKVSLSELYSMWGPGSATGNPEFIHMARGGKRAGAYENNPLWDTNKDGVVREKELGIAALGALGAGKLFSIFGSATNSIESQADLGGNARAMFAGQDPAEALKKSAGEKLLADGRAIIALAESLKQQQDVMKRAAGEKLLKDGQSMVQLGEALQKQQEIMRKGMLAQGKSPEEVEKLIAQTMKKTKVTEEQAIPGLEKLGETATLTAEQIDANRKLAEMEGKDKKKKKDPLFDAAFSKEGIAGDFHGGLSSLLGNLGWEKPTSLAKQFGLGLLRDIQGRMAHDMSSMITGALFGGRGKDGKLTGGLFGGLFGGGPGSEAKAGNDLVPGKGGWLSSFFGKLFGGFRASGGGMEAGKFYVAGENGRELITGPGHVYNNRQTEQMFNRNGDTHVMLAIGDRAVAEMNEQYLNSPRGRRQFMRINGRYGRLLRT